MFQELSIRIEWKANWMTDCFVHVFVREPSCLLEMKVKWESSNSERSCRLACVLLYETSSEQNLFFPFLIFFFLSFFFFFFGIWNTNACSDLVNISVTAVVVATELAAKRKWESFLRFSRHNSLDICREHFSIDIMHTERSSIYSRTNQRKCYLEINVEMLTVDSNNILLFYQYSEVKPWWQVG
jgi:hypothetical protein